MNRQRNFYHHFSNSLSLINDYLTSTISNVQNHCKQEGSLPNENYSYSSLCNSFTLRDPFVISYGSYSDMPSIIVKMETDEGIIGYGEGVADDHVTGESWESTFHT